MSSADQSREISSRCPRPADIATRFRPACLASHREIGESAPGAQTVEQGDPTLAVT